MQFTDDSCQLITGESPTQKAQLSTGTDDYEGGGRGIAAKK